MKRREFITLLGGAAAAWPLAARAQQGERVRRVGVLLPAAADDAEYQAASGVPTGAGALGWTIGRNVRIDTHWATANADCTFETAAELVALAPDVILAHGAGPVGALLQVTRTVPIVFAILGDPVGAGLVDKSGAARRQRHRVHNLRIQSGREMAGAAQTDRAKRDASGGSAGYRRKAPEPACLPPSRPRRRHSGWMSSRSTCATPARSGAPSRPSHAPRMAASS